MFKRIAAASVIAIMMVGGPSVALASEHGDKGDHGDRDNRGEGYGDLHDKDDRAPEPITMIGLGLGAVGIAAARWKSRKSAQTKP